MSGWPGQARQMVTLWKLTRLWSFWSLAYLDCWWMVFCFHFSILDFNRMESDLAKPHDAILNLSNSVVKIFSSRFLKSHVHLEERPNGKFKTSSVIQHFSSPWDRTWLEALGTSRGKGQILFCLSFFPSSSFNSRPLAPPKPRLGKWEL